MVPFRFLQCGDLHLGAPFQYISCPGSIVPQAVREATFDALNTIVAIAIAEEVQFVIITGDVYNSEDHNLEAQIRFVRAMEVLHDRNIDVYMVQGNHDPAESWQAQLTLPPNVHVFSHEGPAARFPLMVKGQEMGGIYGVSCGCGNERTNFTSQYHRDEIDQLSLALMHGSVGMSDQGDMTIGPCSLNDLVEVGMDYWAVGHIHKRQILQEKPCVVYAGNTQGLHRKETGPKGCYVVTVNGAGLCEFEFHETGAIRFEEAHIDITGLTKEAEVLEMIRHKKELIRKQTDRPVLLHLVLEGRGFLYDMCCQDDVRHLWLKDVQAPEAQRITFVMPYTIVDETMPELDLDGRRALKDMVGDYLAAYDKVEGIRFDEQGVRIGSQVALDGDYEGLIASQLRSVIEDRTEFKRLGRYGARITDEMIFRAWRRAEAEGAMKLLGDRHED